MVENDSLETFSLQDFFDGYDQRYMAEKLSFAFTDSEIVWFQAFLVKKLPSYCEKELAKYDAGEMPNKARGYRKNIKFEEDLELLFIAYPRQSGEVNPESEKQFEDAADNVYRYCQSVYYSARYKRSVGYDAMTGLPVTSIFMENVDRMIKSGEILSYNAYYINISGMSLINRKFGSKEADGILGKYGEIIRDFLFEDECVGRLGGDNFVFIIRRERTDEFLDFINGMTVTGTYGGREIPVVISAVAGCLEVDNRIAEAAQVIDDCGVALNIVRREKKSRYLFVTEEIRSRNIRNKEILAGFSQALKNNELQVYYQPKVSAEDYSIVGAEALARWIRDGEIISPMVFIPTIEKNGMICDLDFFVLEQVCKDIRRWIQEGLTPVRVSVNFSRKNLVNRFLAKEIKDVLERYKMESRYIEIELTETVDEAESEWFSAFLEEMGRYGIRTSIDDFGTGYSSLNLLRSFPVDVLKIDKSFIDNLDERDRIVLYNVICMARELEMEVVAEGVETMEQVLYLQKNNCDILQGFLFDKPIPVDEFVEKLKIGSYKIGCD